jgi:DNA replication protein DnaC
MEERMAEDPPFRRPLVKADLTRMNLSEEHWFARFDQVPESVRPVMERYLRNLNERLARADGLYLYGAPGVGKTTVAAVVAKEARAHGFTVYFTRVWELREMIRSRIDFDDETTILGRAREVNLLVLDDLRDEDAREKFFPLSEITALLRDRRERRRVTVITSSVTPEVLDSAVWAAFSNALDGSLVRVEVEGPDLRDLQRMAQEKEVLGS